MTTRKRILFIDGPLGGGGAERVLIDLLRNIDYSHYDVDLAVICRGGALMDEVPPQVNVIELWDGYTTGYKIATRLSMWFRCNRLLSRKMNGPKLRRDYDLEISFLEGMPTKLGALRTTAAKKAAWVHADLDFHRYEAGQFFPGEEIAAYNNMDYVVNVSQYCEDAFRRRFPECTSEMRVIYNPIDRDKIIRMAGEARKHDSFTVVTVGRLTEPKKPERFLDVARLAKEAGLDIKFKWVGDGSLRDALLERTKALGLEDCVEFTGFQKNPFPHIASADVLMVTSNYEGFCLVIPEAMCLGVPVISTRTAGPSEIIGNNEYGILTDFSAPSQFEAFKDLYDKPEKREKLARTAARRPDDYSVNNCINAIADLTI